jgi:hypothetical protein
MAATKNGLGEATVEGYLAGLKGGSGPESWAWSVLDELLARPAHERGRGRGQLGCHELRRVAGET